MSELLLQVRIPGKPVAWSRTGGSSDGHRYNTPQHRSWQQVAGVLMRQGYGRRPRHEGPVCLDVVAVLERPARLAGTARKPVPRGRLPAPKTPDKDNIEKLVADALKLAEVVKDDAQIVDGGTTKVYAAIGEGPSVWVRLRAVAELVEVETWAPREDAGDVANRLF